LEEKKYIFSFQILKKKYRGILLKTILSEKYKEVIKKKAMMREKRVGRRV
jgi:hypothetical protein